MAERGLAVFWVMGGTRLTDCADAVVAVDAAAAASATAAVDIILRGRERDGRCGREAVDVERMERQDGPARDEGGDMAEWRGEAVRMPDWWQRSLDVDGLLLWMLRSCGLLVLRFQERREDADDGGQDEDEEALQTGEGRGGRRRRSVKRQGVKRRTLKAIQGEWRLRWWKRGKTGTISSGKRDR